MLLKRVLFGKVYTAIEHSSVGGKECFHLLQLVYKNKSFDVVDSESFEILENALASLKKGQHVFVIINNDKVLSKKIEGTHEFNKATSIAFPNIKTSDFAIEVLGQKINSFVSICRSSDLQVILEKYATNKINVIGYSLGNSIVSTLVPFLETESIQTSNATISFETAQITSITKLETPSEEKSMVNGLEITPKRVLALSGILSYYSNSYNSQTNFKTNTDTLKDNFEQQQIFSKLLKVGLGFVLIGLLVNFLFFTHFREEISVLSNEQQTTQGFKTTLAKLNNDVIRKRKLASDISSTASSKVSFYIDEVGQSIPKTIVLTQINYQPLQKNLKEFKEILVESNELFIAGTSANSEAFSNWISLLENKDWIEKVAVEDYGVGKKRNISFELAIRLVE
ncbi:MAG: hypothetical protein COB73_07760 [Flavobacteriaceae bacterium]|nr:MAG: hypothetical protein COB73_07760 [Flavobacteriaceae bacterium]